MTTSLVGEPSGESGLFTSVDSVCGVCTIQYSKYKCPRCALKYCSIACYRSHGESCTEGFYAEHAQAVMHSDLAPAEQRIEMMKTLERLAAMDGTAAANTLDDDASGSGSDDDDGDHEGADEAAEQERMQRLARLMEQSSIDETELSAHERAEFRRLLADGSLSAELQAAPVWWSAVPAGSVLPKAASASSGGGGGNGWQYASEAAASGAASAGAPPLPSELPGMSALTSREPPASLLFNLLDVVCSYVYTTRLFCGAAADDPAEAAACLLGLSAVLSGEQRGAHASAEEALLSFAKASERTSVSTSAAFGAACLQDACELVADVGLTAMALAGATALLAEASRANPRAKQRAAAATGRRKHEGGAAGGAMGPAREDDDGGRAALKQARRRAHFLEAWWASRIHVERRAAAGSLQFALRKELERRESLRASVETTRKSKPLPPRTTLVEPV